MGWNQPPERFSSVHTSTLFFCGLAMARVNPEFSTSAQVSVG